MKRMKTNKVMIICVMCFVSVMVGFFGMIVFARESYNVYGTMTLEFDDNVTYTYDSVDFYNGTILVKKDVDSFVWKIIV